MGEDAAWVFAGRFVANGKQIFISIETGPVDPEADLIDPEADAVDPSE